MKRAVTFYDPEEEREDLIALAKAEFRERCKEDPRIRAEEVFPELFNSMGGQKKLIDPLQFEIGSPEYQRAQEDRIAANVGVSFDMAPHMTEKLLDVGTGNSSNPVAAVAKVSSASLTTAKSAPVAPAQDSSSATPSVPPVAPAANSLFSKPHQSIVLSNETPTPNEVAQQIVAVETIRVIGEVPYVYEKGYHTVISVENLKRLIVRDCREVTGNLTPRFVEDVFRLIMLEPNIAQLEVDKNERYLSFENGVIDLDTEYFMPHSPVYPVFYKITAPYIPGGGAHPVFDAYLETATGGDADLKERFLQMIGFCLVPDHSRKYFFILQGVPDSGKSMLARFTRSCINPGASVALDFSELTGHFSADNLIGKQLCLSMDLPSTPLSPKSVGLFKTLTGGDAITADIKYRPHVTFTNQAKFIFGSNHPLITQQADPAFFRRAIALPFRYTVPFEKQDAQLEEKLALERPAIVYDALQAYYRLRQNNYVFCGDFHVNSLFSGYFSAEETASIEENLASFLLEHYQPAIDERVFVEDICEQFVAAYNVPVNTYSFGAKILNACLSLGWTNVRRGIKTRKDGGANPQATLSGLSRKDNGD